MMNLSTPPYLLARAQQRAPRDAAGPAALLPGIAAYVWLIGPGIVVQLAIATLAALAGEALMLRLRGRPLACSSAMAARSSPPG
jgi:Na+-translocating ferredoxin:NAD+ oxidoreductase RnfD subunit